MTPSENIPIRAFAKADLEAVKRLIDETIDSCYVGVYPPNAVQFFKEHHSCDRILEKAGKGYTVVLEDSRRIVGTGTLLGDHVSRVFVAPDAQGRGYGKAIMGALEDRARADGVAMIELSASLPSTRFYERLGYELYEEASIDVGDGETLDFWRARKPLQ